MEMYVLQIKPGYEESTAETLKRNGFTAMCPMEEMHIRHGGEWHKQLKLIFTQYIFIECDLTDEAYYNIKSVSGVVRFLGYGKPEPLHRGEAEYIRLLNNNGRPIEASKIYTTSSGDKMVMSGILRKYTDNIISLDLRQRRAKAKVTFHGEQRIITLPVIGI